MHTIIHDGDNFYFSPDQLYVATFTNEEYDELDYAPYDVLSDPTKLAEPVSTYIPDAPIKVFTRIVQAWLPHAGVYEVDGELQIATGLTTGEKCPLNEHLTSNPA